MVERAAIIPLSSLIPTLAAGYWTLAQKTALKITTHKMANPYEAPAMQHFPSGHLKAEKGFHLSGNQIRQSTH
jgi:hypothetical protein